MSLLGFFYNSGCPLMSLPCFVKTAVWPSVFFLMCSGCPLMSLPCFFYNSGCPLMSLPCLFKTTVVRSSRSYAAVVRSCCYQLFFVVVKEALFMRSTWLFHPHPRISTAIFIFLAAIFGYLAAIFRLSSRYLPIFGGYLRLSCGYLPAISRLSSSFLAIFHLWLSSGYLPAIFAYPPAIYRLS